MNKHLKCDHVTLRMPSHLLPDVTLTLNFGASNYTDIQIHMLSINRLPSSVHGQKRMNPKWHK